MFYDEMQSPVGQLLLAADDVGLRHISFERGRHRRQADTDWVRNPQALRTVREQLDAYFAGTLMCFELPLAPQGSPFQMAVWRELSQIAYGATTSYGAIARKLGDASASRAVGAANGRNPLPIVVPCHRVIGADGSLTGFGGGLPNKQWLLAHEQKIAPFVLSS